MRCSVNGLAAVLTLDEALVVIVGGGQVATRRARRLMTTGARLMVIAPEATEELAAAEEAGELRWQRRGYRHGDLDGAALVVVATDDPRVNRRVVKAAGLAGIWSNVADDADAGQVQFPAVARRGQIRLAVDTDGAGPAVSGALRRHLEATLSPGWERAASLAAWLRPLLQQRWPQQARRDFWCRFADELPAATEAPQKDITTWLEGLAAAVDQELPPLDGMPLQD